MRSGYVTVDDDKDDFVEQYISTKPRKKYVTVDKINSKQIDIEGEFNKKKEEPKPKPAVIKQQEIEKEEPKPSGDESKTMDSFVSFMRKRRLASSVAEDLERAKRMEKYREAGLADFDKA